MFEEKRLSSSTLFKTIIFAGVLCLLIIYRGGTASSDAPKLIAQETEQTNKSDVRQIELTAAASEQSQATEIQAVHAEPVKPSTGDAIGDLITGSIEVEKPAAKSITEIATQEVEPVKNVATAEQITGSNFTVQSGDTLYSISRKTGASVSSLTAANNIKNNVIRVGQVLSIPR